MLFWFSLNLFFYPNAVSDLWSKTNVLTMYLEQQDFWCCAEERLSNKDHIYDLLLSQNNANSGEVIFVEMRL